MRWIETLYVILLHQLLFRCVGARAPLYTTSQDGDEYVVVFKKDASDNPASKVHLMSTVWAAVQRPDSLELLREFHIRDWHAVHVRADHTALDSLRQLPDVLLVESNRQLSLPHITVQREEPGSESTGDGGSRIPQEHGGPLVAQEDGGSQDPHEKALTDDPPDTSPPVTDNLTSPVTTATPGRPVECVSQDTGASLWGLSRINTRQKPADFSGSQYEYSEVDSGAGVDIYVVDSGVYTDHSELRGRATWGMTASGLQYEGNEDRNGHGTHVAAIAAGATYGVAKQANVIAVKVLSEEGSGSIADVVQGIEWIVNREVNNPVKPRKGIVNMSLGSPGPVYTLEAAIQEAILTGLTFVAAAGNEYQEACNVSPARIASVITVGATNQQDKITAFSNYGPCVNILAPGQSIMSAYVGSEFRSAILSGTSQAAPHVAGVVARYLSSGAVAPGDTPTPAQLHSMITDTATTGSIVYEHLHETTTPDRLLYRACSTRVSPEYPGGGDSGATTQWSLTSCTLLGVLLAGMLGHAH